MSIMTDRLTLKQASEYSGFSTEKLREFIRDGQLPAWRRGNRLIVVDQAGLDNLDQPI